MSDYELEHEKGLMDPDTIYMRLDGRLEKEDTEAVLEEIKGILDDIDGDFYLINDISNFKPVDQETVQAIEEGKQLISEHGVTAVVRILGESAVGKMQFERAGDEDYYVATASTREEAEELLDEF